MEGQDYIEVTVTVGMKIPNGHLKRLERLYREMIRRKGQMSAEDAARELRVSVDEFPRKFKAWTGMNSVRARLRVKLEIARTLLIETKAPIVEIAEILGYNDRSNFDHTFTRVMGNSPSRVRRESRARKAS